MKNVRFCRIQWHSEKHMIVWDSFTAVVKNNIKLILVNFSKLRMSENRTSEIHRSRPHVWGCSQTRLIRFCLFLTTYPPVLSISMVWTLTKCRHSKTTYLACLVNVVCEHWAPLYRNVPMQVHKVKYFSKVFKIDYTLLCVTTIHKRVNKCK